jgi:two-component system chemotaxis response regulator CheB
MATTSAPVKVLVVDDSAFMRKVLMSMLASDPRIAVVDSARNGEEAVQKTLSLHPDVVTLDVEMPGMNGIQALTRIMAETPVPVVMVSSLTETGARETLEALDLGAVDYVPKQLDGVVTNIAAVREELLAKVMAASGMAGKMCRRSPSAQSRPTLTLSAATVSATRGQKIVAIGCSTGGPKALQDVLPLLPKDFPAGLVIVQHMPKYFTRPFAERLNQTCAIEVREACHGDMVTPGTALLAPGGMQMRLIRKRAIDVEVDLSPNTEGHLHAPSADVLMESVARAYPGRGIGVILTGMGHDGMEGMRAIKKTQGRTIAQDEATCAVYGMPRAVVEAGCADKIVPLPHIAGEIVNMI